ncbi:MAG: hypothetical protein LBU36_01310 [Clostridiales bacterium]|jgi:hypothetical protein|nr:hypothetical protein [Clostridiales bacterium]
MFGIKKLLELGLGRKKAAPAEPPGGQASPEGDETKLAIEHFKRAYYPYQCPDADITVRPADKTPDDPERPQDVVLAETVDRKRREDPFIGAKLASDEIVTNLGRWLLRDGQISIGDELAVLGAIGGRELKRGVFAAAGPHAAVLGMWDLETVSGEHFVTFGPKLYENFMNFTATATGQGKAVLEEVTAQANELRDKFGSEDYWRTSFDEKIKGTPKELADYFDGKFEFTFKVYCPYLYERAFAYAIAAQKVINGAVQANLAPREELSRLFTEYALRTALFLK